MVSQANWPDRGHVLKKNTNKSTQQKKKALRRAAARRSKYFLKTRQLLLEFDKCVGMPTNIGRYDDVADVSYRQNSADT